MNMPTEERMYLYDKMNETGAQLLALSQNIVSLRGHLETINED